MAYNSIRVNILYRYTEVLSLKNDAIFNDKTLVTFPGIITTLKSIFIHIDGDFSKPINANKKAIT